MKGTKILYVVNDSWFFASHRLAIAKRMIELDFEVYVCAKRDATSQILEEVGCHFIEWRISPRGQGVMQELMSIVSLFFIFLSVRPNLVQLITIKAVLYGGLISRLTRTKCQVCAISGLGNVLENRSAKRSLVMPFYRFAIGHPRSKLIFQNPSNLAAMRVVTGMELPNSELIRGSGVDLEKCAYLPEHVGTKRVVLASRLLKDKGVCEYLEAAEKISELNLDVEFLLAGDDLGAGNPASFTPAELESIRSSPFIKYLGHAEDIAKLFASAHIVVLPSYHEGLPRVLQEAAACGRAVVTTDAPGCVYAVKPGVSALVVPVRDSETLKDAIVLLLEDDERRKSMGLEGRLLAESEFSVQNVVQKHEDIYRQLMVES